MIGLSLLKIEFILPCPDHSTAQEASEICFQGQGIRPLGPSHFEWSSRLTSHRRLRSTSGASQGCHSIPPMKSWSEGELGLCSPANSQTFWVWLWIRGEWECVRLPGFLPRCAYICISLCQKLLGLLAAAVVPQMRVVEKGFWNSEPQKDWNWLLVVSWKCWWALSQRRDPSVLRCGVP